jgi:hypothetical protein
MICRFEGIRSRGQGSNPYVGVSAAFEADMTLVRPEDESFLVGSSSPQVRKLLESPTGLHGKATCIGFNCVEADIYDQYKR